MKYQTLPGTGDRAAVISLGTAPYGTGTDADTAFRLMDAYVEAGGNFLDTAHVYGAWAEDGEGASEKVIGKWLLSNGLRDKMLVATKGAHPVLSTGESRMTRQWIGTHLSQSLDRLGVDRVDYYWLHRDDTSVPVGEILGWMNELVDDGRIRAFGFSNWSLAREVEASQYASEKGLRPFTATQLSWSLAATAPGPLAERGMAVMDDERLAHYAGIGFPVMAYNSQAGGFFGPKYDQDAPDEPKRAGVLKKFEMEINCRRRAAAKRLAREIGADANQVALAWLVGQAMPVTPIVGPRTVEQVRESCAAADLELTPEQLAQVGG